VIKKTSLVVSIVLTVAVLLGIVAMVYANGGTLIATTTPAVACVNNANPPNSNEAFAQYIEENNITMPILPACGWRLGFGRGGGRGGFIEVSQEFINNVTNIAKADPDVNNLLASGYNVTQVRPIIKTVVQANGDVVTKATAAIIALRKDTTGKANVWVDVQAAKVTRIEILTRTVIEKP